MCFPRHSQRRGPLANALNRRAKEIGRAPPDKAGRKNVRVSESHLRIVTILQDTHELAERNSSVAILHDPLHPMDARCDDPSAPVEIDKIVDADDIGKAGPFINNGVAEKPWQGRVILRVNRLEHAANMLLQRHAIACHSDVYVTSTGSGESVQGARPEARQ